ncbi:RimL Acetyltransferases, including N-acetylases of ribosomal proteins [Oxalobacteraceae bacterium]
MEKQFLKNLQISQLSVELEQLTTEHAEAFFKQYRDPSIKKLTNLPTLTSINEVHDWIAEETSTTNSYNYAVLLPKQGFVGFVNLTVSEHAAFFGIWLGTEYQGKGLGTEIGQFVCQRALKSGLKAVLTSAFLTNPVSINMLRKIGFETLSVRADAPHDDRVFFIMTNDPSIQLHGNFELIDYYRREQLPFTFAQGDE